MRMMHGSMRGCNPYPYLPPHTLPSQCLTWPHSEALRPHDGRPKGSIEGILCVSDGGDKDKDDACGCERMQPLPIPSPSHLNNSDIGRKVRPSGRMMGARKEALRVSCV